MKSSSLLFPVELVSAELKDGFYQDVYSLKPNKSTDRSVEIALLHLHLKKDSTAQKQVVFVHDAFQSHWEWMDDGPAQKMVFELLNAGYSIWLMDWRAHGSSKRNQNVTLNTIDEMALNDLTSVVDFIQEKNQKPLNVVAKGYGAQMVLHVLPYLGNVKRCILVNAESILPSRALWVPGVRFFKWIKLIGKDWVSGDGTETETTSFYKKPLKEGGWLGFFVKPSPKKKREELLPLASKIVWICTARRFERKAKRLTKTQSRINRTTRELVIEELNKLVSSQSI